MDADGLHLRGPRRMKALVIVGHGSHLNEDSSLPVYEHAQRIRKTGEFDEVVECFWKEEPSMRHVLDTVEADDVYVVPAFISEGYFTQQVIPRELGAHRARAARSRHRPQQELRGRHLFERWAHKGARAVRPGRGGVPGPGARDRGGSRAGRSQERYPDPRLHSRGLAHARDDTGGPRPYGRGDGAWGQGDLLRRPGRHAPLDGEPHRRPRPRDRAGGAACPKRHLRHPLRRASPLPPARRSPPGSTRPRKAASSARSSHAWPPAATRCATWTTRKRANWRFTTTPGRRARS